MESQVRISRQNKNNKTRALCQPIMFLTSLAQIKNILFFFFLVLFFSELGTEPRALRFLGKRSTTELNPQR